MDRAELTNTLLPSRWFAINEKALLHPEQNRLKADMLDSNYRNFIIAAGRRSFKTERFAKRMMIKKCISVKNKGHFYYMGAPTRQQAKEIFWQDMKQLSNPLLVEKIREAELKIIYRSGVTLRIIGLKEFKRVQGQLMHGIVITEYQDCDPGVYNESIEPMINDTRGWCIKEGRPHGKNHFFDDYLRGKPGSPTYTKGWQSYHWTSEEILTAEQIDEAKSNLSLPDYNREYKASFDEGDQNPYIYDEIYNNRKFPWIKELPAIVMCDFNPGKKPMSWNIGQRFYSKEFNAEITAIHKSLSFQYTKTQTMCEYLDEDYFQAVIQKTFGVYPIEINFYGDYAGDSPTSNSSWSDWDIIQNYFRNKTKITLNIKPCKSIRNSIAATNAQLCNAKGERRLFVDADNCKELVKDWVYCSWKDNGRELEDKDPLRTHSCRAVDYYNDYEFPVKGKTITTSIRTT